MRGWQKGACPYRWNAGGAANLPPSPNPTLTLPLPLPLPLTRRAANPAQVGQLTHPSPCPNPTLTLP